MHACVCVCVCVCVCMCMHTCMTHKCVVDDVAGLFLVCNFVTESVFFVVVFLFFFSK